ncbi:MAG: MarR family winged helix-turn-helix transcriptional regulator [Propionibacteriaceae bacterium]
MSDAEVAGPESVPPRGDWPSPTTQTSGGELLTSMIMTVFELNGHLMGIAEDFAAAGGITATWWRVLGGVLDEPHSVAEVGRRMGMTRQGVQRVADQLVERGLAEYRPNPGHRRAKLLACTEAGYFAVRQISVAQHPWANRVGGEVGDDQLAESLATLRRLMAALAADPTG